MAQIILPQSVLQRHLQALISRASSNSVSSTTAVHPNPGKRSFSEVNRANDKDVDKFKGRLLGVEDGLIDAIMCEPYLDRATDQRVLEPLTSPLWYSQSRAGT